MLGFVLQFFFIWRPLLTTMALTNYFPLPVLLPPSPRYDQCGGTAAGGAWLPNARAAGDTRISLPDYARLLEGGAFGGEKKNDVNKRA